MVIFHKLGNANLLIFEPRLQLDVSLLEPTPQNSQTKKRLTV